MKEGSFVVKVCMVACSLAFVFTIVMYFNSVYQNLNTERNKTIEAKTDLIASSTANMIKDNFESAIILTNAFEALAPNTKEEVFSTLVFLDTMSSQKYTKIFVLCEDNNIYGFDGEKLTFPNVIDNKKISVGKFKFDNEVKDYIIFKSPLYNSCIVEDFTDVKSLIYAVEMERVETCLDILNADYNYHVYLNDSDGNILYRRKDDKFLSDENIFLSFRDSDTISDEDYSSITEAIKAKQKVTKEMSIHSEIHSLGYSFIEDYDIGVTLLISNDNLNNEFYSFNTLIYISTAILALSIGIVIVTFVYLILKSINKKRVHGLQTVLNLRLQSIALDANEASASKSEFLSHISHDVRTPMNGIIGMTNIAKKNLSDKGTIDTYLSKISNTSSHLLTLINDVLDMARIETGKTDIIKGPMNLEELIRCCSDIIEAQSCGKGLEYYNKVEIKKTLIIGDELHLRQILVNVLGNAVKFTNSPGKVIFSVKEEPVNSFTSRYTFIVEDTGVGMKEEYIKHLFDPFVQENNALCKTTSKGTGLGMSIVKKLVDLMNGNIEIESKVGVGTKITIQLEFMVDQDKEVAITQNIDLSLLKGMKVLLVEDNEINMEIAKSMLENVGVIVTPATNGLIGLNYFIESKPFYYEVILMDVMMPEMNGLDATKNIRKLKRPDAMEVPIIALTANAYKDDEEKIRNAGMDAHLIKPIEIIKVYDILIKYRNRKFK